MSFVQKYFNYQIKIKNPIFAIIIGLVFLSINGIPESFADTQSKSTSASTVFDLGPLDIIAKYDLKFNIIVPSEIEAGDTVEITLVPKTGTVTSTVTLSGDKIGTYPADLVFGQEVGFGIPGGYGIGLFVNSNAFVYPSVSGPAQMLSNDWVSLNGMSAKTFRVSVYNDIGNQDSITINIKSLLDTEFGANLNLVLFNQKLASDTFSLAPSPDMKVTIPLKKIIFTNLSLDVRDGTCQGCIQVKPTLTDQDGNRVHTTGIGILVDGKLSQSGLTSNQWSWNFSPGYGSHQIKAEFYGEQSKSNKAITYVKSNDSQGYTIKKIESPTSSSNIKQKSTQSLTCGPGTHVEGSQCVGDNVFDGITRFFEDLIKQFNNLW